MSDGYDLNWEAGSKNTVPQKKKTGLDSGWSKNSPRMEVFPWLTHGFNYSRCAAPDVLKIISTKKHETKKQKQHKTTCALCPKQSCSWPASIRIFRLCVWFAVLVQRLFRQCDASASLLEPRGFTRCHRCEDRNAEKLLHKYYYKYLKIVKNDTIRYRTKCKSTSSFYNYIL